MMAHIQFDFFDLPSALNKVFISFGYLHNLKILIAQARETF